MFYPRILMPPALLAGAIVLAMGIRAEAFTFTFSAFASDPDANVDVFDATLSLSVASLGEKYTLVGSRRNRKPRTSP